jgi:hypothetical protein
VANSLFYRAKGDERYIKTLYEIEHPKPVDTRTGDEVAIDIINKLGLKLEG